MTDWLGPKRQGCIAIKSGQNRRSRLPTTPPSNQGNDSGWTPTLRASVPSTPSTMRAMTNQTHIMWGCCCRASQTAPGRPRESRDGERRRHHGRLGCWHSRRGRGLLGVVGTFSSGTDGSQPVAGWFQILSMPRMVGVLVVRRSHGTHSGRSHRSPDISFSSVSNAS